MSNVFLVSDTHFGHHNMLKFTNPDGTRVRPFWENADDMNADMIQRWNSVVGANDKVYHLGDVVINRKYLHIMSQLNGKKVLIKGNHDIFKITDYLEHFYDIRSYHTLANKLILSHIPIHPMEISRFKFNVHGHLHEKIVMDENGSQHPKYFSVCVEKINYTPIPLETVLDKLKDVS